MIVDDVSELQPFDFAWPEGPEHFDRGWDYTASIGSTSFRARHGIGGREVYGRYRVHSVTWLDGQPMVEGVAADDYAESGSLLSTLRIEGKAHVRDWSELPIGYAGFTIVRQSDEIVAKYSRRSLAVKILEDDLAGVGTPRNPAGSVKGSRRRGSSLPEGRRITACPRRDRCPPHRTSIVLPSSEPCSSWPNRRRPKLNKSGEPFFTPNALANRFLIENPFAFLLAVIFDQGIVAERAWAAPYELAHRLGHLDPYRLADDLPGIAKAVATPPMLQRFVNTIPPWIASAARRVVRDYGGDAGRIWGDEPTAEVLDRRLRAFDGIGQKKAAMAVEMLERDLKVPIKGLHGTDIAYDVHVRRVFLRTGLADRDDRDHMIAQGRRAQSVATRRDRLPDVARRSPMVSSRCPVMSRMRAVLRLSPSRRPGRRCHRGVGIGLHRTASTARRRGASSGAQHWGRPPRSCAAGRRYGGLAERLSSGHA